MGQPYPRTRDTNRPPASERIEVNRSRTPTVAARNDHTRIWKKLAFAAAIPSSTYGLCPWSRMAAAPMIAAMKYTERKYVTRYATNISWYRKPLDGDAGGRPSARTLSTTISQTKPVKTRARNGSAIRRGSVARTRRLRMIVSETLRAGPSPPPSTCCVSTMST